MPIPSTDSLHADLDRALKAGDFSEATQLSAALGAALTAQLDTIPNAERRAVLERHLALMQEHLSLARVLRAHVASRLQSNTAACLYQEAGDAASCWRFDA